MDQSVKRTWQKANSILLACVLFNLSIGGIFAWSVFRTRLSLPIDDGGWGWTGSQAGLPYTVAIVMWSLGVLVGGRIQDRIGPRMVVTAGGIMTALGLMLSGIIGNSPIGIILSYGVLTGVGIGFGYGCVIPPALKWFHPSKKGLISGLVVGAFGIAAVYFAPLANILFDAFTISQTFIILGVMVLIISTPMALLVKNPPEGYIPPEPASGVKTKAAAAAVSELSSREMVRTKRFYLMALMFTFAASVGLMVIGNMTRIANIQVGITDTAFLAGLVSFLAITNFIGRIVGGFMSDKIGRINALYVVFGVQAANMFAFAYFQSLPLLILGIIAVGFCYGTLMSVFPSLTADQYGLKNYGSNYGIVYLFWGLAGTFAPIIADYFFEINGDFRTTYIICGVTMVAMLFVNYLLKREIAMLNATNASS